MINVLNKPHFRKAFAKGLNLCWLKVLHCQRKYIMFFHVCFPLGLHIIFSLTLCIVCLNPLCKSLSIIPKGFSLPDPLHYICIILLLFVKRSEHTQLNPKVPESRLDKFEESNSSLHKHRNKFMFLLCFWN